MSAHVDAVKQGQADASQVPRIHALVKRNAVAPLGNWAASVIRHFPIRDIRFSTSNSCTRRSTPVYQGGGARGGTSSATPTTEGVGRRGGRFRRGTCRAARPRQTPVARRARGGGGGRFGGGIKAAALAQLLDRIAPAILIVHSASGETGFEATRLRPQLVTALVAVEVVGSPTDPDDIRKALCDANGFIGVFGDHFDVRPNGRGRLVSLSNDRAIDQMTRAAKPESSGSRNSASKGNTHLLMQDNKNDDIAAMILQGLGD